MQKLAPICCAVVVLMLLAFSRNPQRTRLKKGLYVKTELGGLCTRSIYIINDSLFSFEGGCEGSSHHYFGRWYVRRDTFIFSGDSALFINPILGIKSKRLTTDSLIVRVLNECGVTVPYVKIAVRTKNGNVRLLSYHDADSIYVCRPLTEGETLHLYSLEKGYGRLFILPTNDANYFEVTTFIPPNIPMTSWSSVRYAGTLRLLKRGDNLVAYGPERGGDTAAFNYVKE